MIELTPLKENYNIRYYIDRNKKIIDYYIDITFGFFKSSVTIWIITAQL